MTRFVVFQERANPSTAYFVAPALAGQLPQSIVYVDSRTTPDVSMLDGAVIVLVRYLWPHWRRVIESAAGRIAGLVYFMDDDLFDPSAWGGLPIRYRWKMWRRACQYRGWIERRADRVWVSTKYLQDKYASALNVPLQSLPLSLPDTQAWASPGVSEAPCFFYHGSASHGAEAEWLHPIVVDVLRRCPGSEFEIIASGRIAKMYGRLPRTRVVPPMGWNEYVKFCNERLRAVGLAPMLGGRFNCARSPVKLMDIARAGGVGIYSENALFDHHVTHGVDGVLIDNDPARWTEAIVGLLSDSSRRAAMRVCARERIIRDFGRATPMVAGGGDGNS